MSKLSALTFIWRRYLCAESSLTLYNMLNLFVGTSTLGKGLLQGLLVTIALMSEGLAEEPQDDFSVGILFLLLIGIGFSLICIGVGIVLTILAILFLVGLISFGLVSSSVVVGIYEKSFLKGVKAFVRLSAIAGGAIAGSAALWTLNKFAHWWTAKSALVAGAGIGSLSGYVLSIFLFYMFRKLVTYLKQFLPDGSILKNSLKP